MSTPLFSIVASRHHRLQEYWIAQNGVATSLDNSNTMNKGLGVAPKVVAGVTAGLICVTATLVVILVVCWRYPFCRTRTFWDHGVKKIIRKIYSYFSGIRQQKQEEKLRLVAGVFTRKASRQETRFVVPQIFIHRHSLCYGSQQVVPYTFELEDYRRGSTSSVSSRKSSLSSRKSSMSGRDSIISFDGRLFWPDSRRGSSSSRKSSDGNLSLLPDDRRGSGSSRSSRKSSDGGLSLINDYDRRGSNSSRKSSDGGLIPFFSDYDRRGSNSSRSSRKSSDAGHSNLSFEGESDYSTEAYDFDDGFRFYGRRVRFRRDSPVDFMAGAVSAAMMAGFQIRRSNSLAEMRRLNLVAATPQDTSAGKPRPRMDRRATLSSLVVSSLQALDQTVNPVAPSSYLKKKVKVARRGSIGLPFDTPLLMHDLNLEEMRMPRTMSPVQPVGTLEIHLQFNEAKTSISVTVIKANNLSAVGAPPEELFNPYVKVFLIPGRSSKFKTKIVNKTQNPVFEENFRITDLPSGDFNDESGLEFQVYSHDSVTRKPLLGVCSMRLAEIDHLEDGYAELTLLPQTYHKCHQGDLRISGCYQPVAGKMVFNILEAKNLPKVSLMGTINPYVKVEMYLNGIREAKQKTKTKQNVQDPLWHHQCLFEVNRENPKLLGHTFLFSVMHRDRMRGTQLIGQVELGWYSHGEQLDHWCEIMEHPHRPTDNWHPVIKTCKSPS